ncbi:MAG: hypothetical protein Q4E11_07520 [Corynebacterium sp.]|uniref:hypothetical protein n=1 Tax=Corynebacterium sp. TaxID=1720 RepID=UPI0026DC8DA3|nr:hypothetical protein [Corynebacterium sp.]MDO5030416.1 hypothetical protein [Corynebacterium sp.]
MTNFHNAFIVLTATETLPLIQEHMPDRSPEGAPWEFEVKEILAERIEPAFRRVLTDYIDVVKGENYEFAPNIDKEEMLDGMIAHFGKDTLLTLIAKDSFTAAMKYLAGQSEKAVMGMIANLK